MPPFSMIYQWRAYLYVDHPPPHFHLRHAGKDVVIEIETGRILHGKLSGELRREVVAWLERNRTLILRNWERVQCGSMPEWVNFP